MDLEEFLREWNNSEETVLVRTSGSTGEPKPMWVEKRRMRASAHMTCDYLGLKAGDTALLCMSLDYIAGKMMVVRALERGLKLIHVEPSGHPLQTSNFKAPDSEFQMDFAAMVPMQVWNSLQVAEERERLLKIRHLIIGGGAISPELERELRDFPNAVWSTYGMTETLSHVALRRLNGAERSLWYTPMEGVRISQADDGCLVIEAPRVSDGLLKTNDIAEIEGTRFRILGRKDNVICSGGVKIQAEEVERELSDHLSCGYLISKRADEKFGEVVVLLTEGSIEEAQTACRKVLPKYHQPRAYIHVEHIPLTATGKPARAEALKIVADVSLLA